MRGSRHHGYGQIEGHRKKPAGGCGETTNWKKFLRSYYAVQKKMGFPNHYYGKNRPSPWIIGKHGFKLPQKVQRINKINEINISTIDTQIDKWVEQGLAEKSGSTYTVDLSNLGYQKLLARGSTKKKINITVLRASLNAIEEIQNAGGSVNTEIENYKLEAEKEPPKTPNKK